MKTAVCNLMNIQSIRKYLTVEACKVVLNLVVSHLDYGNFLYFRLPTCDISHLQKTQNAAAILVAGHSKHVSSTEALKLLHWLPNKQRIKFKIAVLV